MPVTRSKKRTRVLKAGEIKTLWPNLNPMLRFILLSGQRVSEVIDMEWKDLEIGDIPEQEYNAPTRYPAVRWTQPDNKTGVPHVLPLPPLAVAQLPHYLDNGTPVFGGQGAVFKSKQTLKKYSSPRSVRFMLPKGMIDHFTVHDLRRTALTNVARLMQSAEAAERVANHALGGVASRYNLYSFEEVKGEALAKWSQYILGLTEGA